MSNHSSRKRMGGIRVLARLTGATLAAMAILSGCVPPMAPDAITGDDDPTPDSSDVPATYRFAEDDDPDIAALPFTEGELLAKILPGADQDDLNASYEAIGVTVLEELAEIQTIAVGFDPGAMNEVASAITQSPFFESVHKSYQYDAEQVPDDGSFSRQAHFETIGVDTAWNTTTGDEDMIIAILDTGVEPDHPDLEDKLLRGWNTYDKNTDSDDVLGHGTSVAGSAAAISDNGEGVAGVAWDNPILPVRVTNDRGSAASRDIASGILWAVGRGAKVINVSFAPLGSDRTVLAAAQAARNAGALVFISTGNNAKRYRARANVNAVFVGAVDAPDELAEFSNTGAFVDLVAPGTRIYTTKREQGYGNVSGTSFASPIVAGVAALVWSVNPDFRPTTVQDILYSTAVDLGDRGKDDDFGLGRVDAAAAVAAALDIVEEDDTTDPRVEIIKPDDRETVSRVINVSVGAFDAGGLADVVLTLDGEPFATDPSDPFRFAVNTRKLTNGLHTLTATATDLSGNARTSTRVRIIVEGGRTATEDDDAGDESPDAGNASGTAGVETADTTPPEAAFNFPADGTRVFTAVGVQATISDNDALRRAEWLVDGVRQEVISLTGTRQVVSFLWNAADAASGPHGITLRVEDVSRNEISITLNLVKE